MTDAEFDSAMTAINQEIIADGHSIQGRELRAMFCLCKKQVAKSPMYPHTFLGINAL